MKTKSFPKAPKSIYAGVAQAIKDFAYQAVFTHRATPGEKSLQQALGHAVTKAELGYYLKVRGYFADVDEKQEAAFVATGLEGDTPGYMRNELLVGRHVKGPGGEIYKIQHIISPHKIIASGQSGELVGLEKKWPHQAWGDQGARYFGLRGTSELPEAVRRYTAPRAGSARKARPKAHSSFNPEGFDLCEEMQTGYCITDNYHVSYGGKFVHDARGWDEALKYVWELRSSSGDFSNVFYINKRGNVDLISIVPGRGGKYTHKLIHSWV